MYTRGINQDMPLPICIIIYFRNEAISYYANFDMKISLNSENIGVA